MRRAARRAWAPLRPYFAGLDAASVAIPVAACAAILLAHYHGRRGHFRRWFDGGLPDWPLPEIHDYLFWFAASAVLYGALTAAVVVALPRERLRDYGAGPGDWRTGLLLTALLYAVMLPFIVAAARLDAFAGTYPLARGALSSWSHMAVYQAGYALYFVGWEWLFRGFLLFGLHRRIGNHAIWAQLIPFVILHAGKPELEAYGSIVAGVALAVLALRTGSFWYGALLHAAVATTMDLLSAVGRVG